MCNFLIVFELSTNFTFLVAIITFEYITMISPDIIIQLNYKMFTIEYNIITNLFIFIILDKLIAKYQFILTNMETIFTIKCSIVGVVLLMLFIYIRKFRNSDLRKDREDEFQEMVQVLVYRLT